ncbi:MAG TPA: SatD family protein [Bacillota bacterium]|nr:SatD family protein [Bacillota bacterium]
MEYNESVCLLADVIDSRKNRKYKQLHALAGKLNNVFQKQLIVPFQVRAGDELYGVVEQFQVGYDAFQHLYRLSKNKQIPFYVGVGFGTIYFEPEQNEANANGPAIWRAADALKMTKIKGEMSLMERKKAFQYIQRFDDTFKFFFYVDQDLENNFLLNFYVYFLLEKIEQQTPRQREAIQLIEKYPTLTYEEIGKKLGYEGENIRIYVSNLLRRGEYHLIKEAEKELKRFLLTFKR